MKICGIDEAGRGAVIGPMVVAGVLLDVSRVEELTRMGGRDSKELTPGVRAELSKLLRDLAERVEIIVIEAEEIDRSTRRSGASGLNRLEARIFAKLIDELKPDAAYIDLPSTKYEEFRDLIESLSAHRCALVLEHKADRRYPIVAASSIIAKHERDRRVELLKSELGDFGSGYPSDPKTREFLSRILRGEIPPSRHVRFSWKTLSRIAQRRLDEF